MKKRAIEIIQRIIEDPQFYDIIKLKNIFNKSERTIKNDIDEINFFLEQLSLPLVIVKKSGQIKWETTIDFYLIRDKLNFYDYSLDSEERTAAILLVIIFLRKHVTLQQIASILFVSRSTVMSDMKKVKKMANRHNVQIDTLPNKGIVILAEEHDIRKIFYQISKTHGYLIYMFLHQIDDVETEHIFGIATNESLIVIKKIVREWENKLKICPSTYIRTVLVQNIYFTIFCNLNGQASMVEPENKVFTKFDDVLVLYQHLVQYFDLVMLPSEYAILAAIIGELQYFERIGGGSVNNEHIPILQIQTVSRNFIEEISKSLGINLNNDYFLFENLTKHLYRVFNTSDVLNIELKELQSFLEKNVDVYEISKKNAEIIEAIISRRITTAELGYIVIYLCGAIEKKKMLVTHIRVLVVCNHGISSSQWLSLRLKGNYNFNIVATLSTKQFYSYDLESIDLIVTTTQLISEFRHRVPIVQVSASYTEKDNLEVNTKIQEIIKISDIGIIKQQEKDELSGALKSLDEIFGTYPGLPGKLTPVIKQYFTTYQKQKVMSLSDYLQPSFITVDVDAKDWKDAIRKSCLILEQKAYVTQTFSQEIIDVIKEIGPYIIFSENIALPHGGENVGALKTGFSLIKLKEPVKFGIEELDPVSIICTLSAIDDKEHVSAFFTLVNLLGNPVFKQQLMHAKNSETIYSCIKQFE